MQNVTYMCKQSCCTYSYISIVVSWDTLYSFFKIFFYFLFLRKLSKEKIGNNFVYYNNKKKLDKRESPGVQKEKENETRFFQN